MGEQYTADYSVALRRVAAGKLVCFLVGPRTVPYIERVPVYVNPTNVHANTRPRDEFNATVGVLKEIVAPLLLEDAVEVLMPEDAMRLLVQADQS